MIIRNIGTCQVLATNIVLDQLQSFSEKIVLKVANLKELEQVKQDAIELNVSWSEVTDAGHTQIAPGTVTCISLGPAPEEKIDKITGDLKLM